MDEYFEKIDKILKDKQVKSRIRFMLQDLQDLRRNNWKPRKRDEFDPKTITQIHEDAQKEKIEKQAQLAKLSNQQRSSPQKATAQGLCVK